MGSAKMSEVRRHGKRRPTASLLSVRWPLAQTRRVSPKYLLVRSSSTTGCWDFRYEASMMLLSFRVLHGTANDLQQDNNYVSDWTVDITSQCSLIVIVQLEATSRRSLAEDEVTSSCEELWVYVVWKTRIKLVSSKTL